MGPQASRLTVFLQLPALPLPIAAWLFIKQLTTLLQMFFLLLGGQEEG
jgi:hypothetical protein